MLDDPRCVSRRLALCGIICVLRYNNNDSDDIAWNDDERSKTTPTLATVMNFIIAFSLSLSSSCARTHVYTTRKERAALRCCCCSRGIRATDSLLSFLGDISEDGNGVTENQGGRRQPRRWCVVGEREECRG